MAAAGAGPRRRSDSIDRAVAAGLSGCRADDRRAGVRGAFRPTHAPHDQGGEGSAPGPAGCNLPLSCSLYRSALHAGSRGKGPARCGSVIRDPGRWQRQPRRFAARRRRV